jgi:hypothetical protein
MLNITPSTQLIFGQAKEDKAFGTDEVKTNAEGKTVFVWSLIGITAFGEPVPVKVKIAQAPPADLIAGAQMTLTNFAAKPWLHKESGQWRWSFAADKAVKAA